MVEELSMEERKKLSELLLRLLEGRPDRINLLIEKFGGTKITPENVDKMRKIIERWAQEDKWEREAQEALKATLPHIENIKHLNPWVEEQERIWELGEREREEEMGGINRSAVELSERITWILNDIKRIKAEQEKMKGREMKTRGKRIGGKKRRREK